MWNTEYIKDVKSMRSSETIIRRIMRMELYFDMIRRALKEGLNVCSDFPLNAVLDELVTYYESGQWLSDYEADERGEIPSDLKRGVLSEDGMYNLLSELNDEAY